MATVYRRAGRLATFLGGAIVLANCAGEPASRPSEAAAPMPADAQEETPAPGGPLVVFLGDSLTAGYGLAQDEAYPALVGERLREKELPIRIVNAGVSGDTSAGGLTRLGWILKQNPDVLVVALGGNDALRGQPIESIEENLRSIVTQGRDAGARVLLLGQRIPTNYGPDYAEAFAALYARVARETGVTLMPFLLDGVGGQASLNLPDGIHPNARGHAIIAGNVTPYVERLVQEEVRH